MNEVVRNLETIFGQAIEIDSPDERRDFLTKACQGDAPLHAQLNQLVENHFRSGNFLETPIASIPVTALLPSVSERPGTVIGPYKLLQQIGEGGMGVVFMAEQSEPIHRMVALKIIKPGMDTRQVIARFEAERQALALMDHPNIARVLDAGTAGSEKGVRNLLPERPEGDFVQKVPDTFFTGRPYFVMDLVKGIPITEYCDQNHLSIRERLELMTQVCHAVQHAHQKGIIHRDLKPSNVLVAEYDGKPVPKVIDFGVAKATAQKLTEKTMFTEYGQLVGTFEYMSPEQARFNQLDVDTRSDIYSLGVLLYELLAGSTPLEKDRLHSAAFNEILRMIAEEEPVKPSTRIARSSWPGPINVAEKNPTETVGLCDSDTIAANRNTEPAKLTKQVSGELDWIVMKCLEKDRNRRYESASALAADIGRYLADETVAARPATTRYRINKFVRRNKTAVLAGSVIVVTLAAGLILSSIGFVQARRQAIRADNEAFNARSQAERSDQIAEFLKDILKTTGGSTVARREPEFLRGVLGGTSLRIAEKLKSQPDVQGDLWLTLGDTFMLAGDYPNAMEMYQHAADSFRLAFGDDNIQLALALGFLGRCQSFQGNYSDGMVNARLGLEMARESGDPETLATCLLNAARANSFARLMSQNGVPMLREAVAIRRQLKGDPVALATCIYWLAAGLDSAHGDEKESLAREALGLHRQHLGTEHPSTVDGLFRLGQVLLDRRKLEEAETVLRNTVDLYRKVHEQNHPYQPLVLRLYCDVLLLRGKLHEAQVELQKAVERNPSNAEYPALLAGLGSYQGDWPAVTEELSAAVKLDRKKSNSRTNHDLQFQLIVALLKAESREEYSRRCRAFLNQVELDSTEFHYIDMAAKATLLLPLGGSDFHRACQMADLAATATEPSDVIPWFALGKAIADLRRERFESAAQLANSAITNNQAEPECQAASYFVAAAAFSRLKQNETAHEAFSKGDKLVAQRNEIDRDPLGSWVDWTIAEMFRDEAAELLGISEPAKSTDAAKQP